MVQSNIYEYENKHLNSSIAHVIQSKISENSSIAQLVTDENENKNFYHSNCYSSTAHLKGSTKLEQHWIGPTSVNRDNIGLTPALTDTNFIVKQQCLSIRYILGRMFRIDEAKQDEQNGVDQLWIGPTLERPDGDGNGEQIDAEQSFAMEFGNFSSDKL